MEAIVWNATPRVGITALCLLPLPCGSGRPGMLRMLGVPCGSPGLLGVLCVLC
jgi:hypothetical protein